MQIEQIASYLESIGKVVELVTRGDKTVIRFKLDGSVVSIAQDYTLGSFGRRHSWTVWDFESQTEPMVFSDLQHLGVLISNRTLNIKY